MKDRLENFIKDNREAFDDQVPDLKVWAAIDKELSKEEKPQAVIRPLRRFLSIAAAIAFLLTIGAAIGLQMGQQRSADPLASSEFQEAKVYYDAQIREKRNVLASYSQSSVVQEDLEQLEDFLQELKSDLEVAPPENREQIINAMILNYRTRLEILDRVLNKIESTNQGSNQSKCACPLGCCSRPRRIR